MSGFGGASELCPRAPDERAPGPRRARRRRTTVGPWCGVGVFPVRLFWPEPSPRVDGAGPLGMSPALAFRQDVRELLVEIEVPVFRAGRHGRVRPLQEGLQGPRRGLEQGLALGRTQGDADDALAVTA